MEECQTDRTTSLVLADPDAVVRQGLVAFCAGHPDLAIAGECSDGVTLLKMIETVRPDFVLLELHLLGVAGTQMVYRQRTTGSPTRVIVLTTQRDFIAFLLLLTCGAHGYLVKDGPGQHLLDAIAHIRKGGVYMSPPLRDALRSELHAFREKKGLKTGGKPGGGNGPGEDDGSGGMAAVVGLPIGRPPRPRQRSS